MSIKKLIAKKVLEEVGKAVFERDSELNMPDVGDIVGDVIGSKLKVPSVESLVSDAAKSKIVKAAGRKAVTQWDRNRQTADKLYGKFEAYKDELQGQGFSLNPSAEQNVMQVLGKKRISSKDVDYLRRMTRKTTMQQMVTNVDARKLANSITDMKELSPTLRKKASKRMDEMMQSSSELGLRLNEKRIKADDRAENKAVKTQWDKNAENVRKAYNKYIEYATELEMQGMTISDDYRTLLAQQMGKKRYTQNDVKLIRTLTRKTSLDRQVSIDTQKMYQTVTDLDELSPTLRKKAYKQVGEELKYGMKHVPVDVRPTLSSMTQGMIWPEMTNGSSEMSRKLTEILRRSDPTATKMTRNNWTNRMGELIDKMPKADFEKALKDLNKGEVGAGYKLDEVINWMHELNIATPEEVAYQREVIRQQQRDNLKTNINFHMPDNLQYNDDDVDALMDVFETPEWQAFRHNYRYEYEEFVNMSTMMKQTKVDIAEFRDLLATTHSLSYAVRQYRERHGIER